MKEVLDIPVITTGHFNDMRLAEQVLERNKADYIHMLRDFHADPEILTKTLENRIDDINMCMACNKCIDLMFGDRCVCCTVNPECGRKREMTLKPAAHKKSVMVVVGGLACMEAARVAALRGHQVSL